MAESKGNTSIGIVIDFVGDDSGSFGGEVTDINKTTEATDMADVSHQLSPNKYREFRAGFTNGGTITFSLNFDPDAAMPASGEKGTLTMTVPWSDAAAAVMTVKALCTEKGSFDAPLGDKVSGEITFQLTEEPSWAAAGP